MAIRPNIPKGFADTPPIEALEIERIQDVLRQSYRRFGFLPLDTPAVEYRAVLTGSEAGVAGDNQIFTVANIDYGREQPVSGPNGKSGYLIQLEFGLRFDLTVPLARFIAERSGTLTFPFKRYQMGKVWRGEKPQSGRYREFIQCDIDTISDSELTPHDDAEALACADDAFRGLGIENHFFKVNNRRAVQELLKVTVGDKADVAAVLRVLDKRDKVDDRKILALLESEAGIVKAQAKKLLEQLEAGYQKGLSPEFDAALDELNEYVKIAVALGVSRDRITIDPSLARGLGYYTGNVAETFITGAEDFGSVCSGGRYDNLTKHYGSKRFPGTGLSIGLSRLQAAVKERDGQREKGRELDLYLGVLSPEYRSEIYALLKELRQQGLSVICNPAENRVKKLMKQADRSPCRYVLIIGEAEIASRTGMIKNLESGTETEVSLDELGPQIRRLQDSAQ